MPLKLVTDNDSVLQLGPGRGPLSGLRPWTPLGGGFRPLDLLSCAVQKFPLKVKTPEEL